MKKGSITTRKKRCRLGKRAPVAGPAGLRRAAFLACTLLVGSVLSISAGENWNFAVGAGAGSSNVYSGSDESYIMPIPFLMASYKTGNLAFSAATSGGIGITYQDEVRHLLASIGVSSFGERDSEEYIAAFLPRDHSRKTRDLLDGSPTASSIVSPELTLGWLSPVGILGASLKYCPTTLEGDEDELFHAFLPSVFWYKPFPISEKLSVTGVLTAEFMDQNFADAWYTVEKATAELDTFEAKAGLRDIRLLLQVDYMFTNHIGATFLAENSLLVMDAADSPYTRSRYQLTSGFIVFYAF